MEFPYEVREKIEELAGQVPTPQMARLSEEISAKYRSAGADKRLMTREQAIAYAAVRMPATFGSVSAALEYALEFTDENFQSVTDIGAGTGAAALAADRLLAPEKIVCVEREAVMREVGKELFATQGGALKNAEWKAADISKKASYCAEDGTDGSGSVSGGGSGSALFSDLVLSSYMLNELSAEELENAVSSMWELTAKMLLVVEPGTPEGFGVIRRAREILKKNGAYIAAPCPHREECPVTDGDWCHFACRIQRSRLHRQLKGGDAPYEDEKFAYIAAVRKPCEAAKARTVRHPFVEKGRISLRLCTRNGLENRAVLARDKQAFKAARKLGWGDNFSF